MNAFQSLLKYEAKKKIDYICVCLPNKYAPSGLFSMVS